MNQAIREWQEAVERADAGRERIAQINLAELPVPPEMLAEVDALEEDVLAKLRAVYRSRL